MSLSAVIHIVMRYNNFFYDVNDAMRNFSFTFKPHRCKTNNVAFVPSDHAAQHSPISIFTVRIKKALSLTLIWFVTVRLLITSCTLINTQTPVKSELM